MVEKKSLAAARTERDKVAECTGFIKDHAKMTSKEGEKDLKLTISQADYTKFMVDQGVTKDILKQVSDANATLFNGQIAALTDHLVDNPALDKATINTRTPSGVISIRQTRMTEPRNPTTGDTFLKYGPVALRIAMKSQVSRALVDECAAAIQAASE